MTELDELKYRFFKDSVQVCMLDRRGFVAYSCNTLLNFDRYKAVSVLDDIPMLESIWSDVILLEGDKRISITRIELEFGDKTGFYDYHFELYPEDPKLILWYLVDQNATYTTLHNLMQQRNEMYIKRES